MEKQVLKEKILKAVGLNAEYIDKVFDNFLKRVSEVLQVGQTIKFEEIGFFQLRVEPVSRLERDSSKKSKKILIFKGLDINERLTFGSPFLTFEVDQESSPTSEFSESVFNLSIDKPSTIFDESDSEDAQPDDLLDASIQDYVNQLIASGVILDGYELLGKGSVEKIDEDETLSSDIIKEVSRAEPIEPILESEEPLDQDADDAIETNRDDSKYKPKEETLSGDTDDSLLEIKKEIESEPEVEKKNPFDELNDLINQAKEPEAEEKVNNQAVYDEIKSSVRSEDKGSKRLIILLFAAVFIILLTAIIYFTSAPTETPTKLPTFTSKAKEAQSEVVVKPTAIVDSTVTDSSKNKETSSQVALLKEEAKEPVIKAEPKKVVKTNYSGLYRKIANDVSITDRIYFDSKKYTVQISSWKSKTIAEHEVQRLKKLGFDAFIYRVYIKSKDGTYHRVRIGYFDSKKEAAEFLKKNKL